ncbi:MAG: asparagine synthetase B, partial [Gammaproteobacteria bacterium]|nr:asparagine synthetase B [Gammaproteobacteria bacterium]
MCGISFIFDSVDEILANNPIDLMVTCLNHRGPDAQGSVIKRHAALGHTRLSIVDIKGGSQPMSS